MVRFDAVSVAVVVSIIHKSEDAREQNDWRLACAMVTMIDNPQVVGVPYLALPGQVNFAPATRSCQLDIHTHTHEESREKRQKYSDELKVEGGGEIFTREGESFTFTILSLKPFDS